MVGDGVSDLETRPSVDLFVGYGGYAARERVRREAAASSSRSLVVGSSRCSDQAGFRETGRGFCLASATRPIPRVSAARRRLNLNLRFWYSTDSFALSRIAVELGDHLLAAPVDSSGGSAATRSRRR